MKRSTITTVLLVVVLGGLVASTGYAFNLMTSYKDKYESQSKTNDRLVEENKKIADISKKNAEELEKQKKSIEELEKKNKELTAAETTTGQNVQGVQSQVNQDVAQQPITDYQSEEDKQFIEQKSAENKERIAQEEAKANEPQYAVFEGNAYRFAINNGITTDELLSLNGLSDITQLVSNQSYRIK
ncbi:hypothetical protein [uncultured Vagococcus sp.]|uniref:hypothetical protein n=1 Tax=uncultured Vagococcus sp. TaxID=189676 RepID=UPI0028D0CE62|nr:hypothetical protein [uncultured Vagococcus sp.]